KLFSNAKIGSNHILWHSLLNLWISIFKLNIPIFSRKTEVAYNSILRCHIGVFYNNSKDSFQFGYVLIQQFHFIKGKLNNFSVFNTLYVIICRFLRKETTKISSPPVFYCE